MKYVRIIIIPLLTIFLSCGNAEAFTKYKFNDITITRIDKDNSICLYFGDYNNTDKLPEDYITLTYKGFHDMIDAYLIFNKTNVEILIVSGYYDNRNLKNVNLKKFKNNSDFIIWNDSINNSYNNICRISNIMNYEQRINSKNKSNVKVEYPFPQD
jgi:hypothetical protein